MKHWRALLGISSGGQVITNNKSLILSLIQDFVKTDASVSYDLWTLAPLGYALENIQALLSNTQCLTCKTKCDRICLNWTITETMKLEVQHELWKKEGCSSKIKFYYNFWEKNLFFSTHLGIDTNQQVGQTTFSVRCR